MPRRHLVATWILFIIWLMACVSGSGNTPPGGAKVGSPPGPAPANKEFADLLQQAAALENSDAEQSQGKAEQALALARQRKNSTEAAAALYQLGHTLATRGLYTEAMTTAQQGLSLAKTLENKRQAGEFYRLISRLFWFTNDLPDAAANSIESLHIAQAIGDKTMEQRAEEILGLIYSSEDELDSARQHLLAALRLGEENHSSDRAIELSNLGELDFKRHDYTPAREYYKQALALVRQEDALGILPGLLSNLGDIASIQGDQVAAAAYLDEAFSLAKRSENELHIGNNLRALAAMNRRQGQLDQARSFLQQSLAIAQNPECATLLPDIYDEYIQLAKARGDYKEAFEYAGKLAEQNELVRGEKSKRKVFEVQRHYELQAHTQEVEMLQRDKDLQRAELALKKTELSRAGTQRLALLAVMICVGVAVAALVSRQRTRARVTQQVLAEVRAAKAQVEAADARKAQLLAIAAHDLQESEARFRSAFECSALGMSLSQLDGRWLRVNEALCKIVGYRTVEMLEMSALDITHKDDRDENQRLLDQLIRGEIESYHLEKRIFHRDGRIIWMLVDVAVVREPTAQRPLYVISQFQDITQRRSADEQLHLAKEEAEKANEAKNEFLSRISHELRTPLNAILGFGQLMEIELADQRQLESLDHILKAGRHLLALVDEVLDITRIESGQLDFACLPVPVATAVAEAVDLTRPLAEQAQISLLIEGQGAGDCQVHANDRRLRQVLLNLLSNAIKYNRTGGMVSVSCRTTGQDRLRIEIKDTGPGIAAEDLENIFAPFTRLPATQAIQGTGLGLSLSRSLVEVMGGTLGVCSKVGCGSMFWVELALADDPLDLSAMAGPGAVTAFL